MSGGVYTLYLVLMFVLVGHSQDDEEILVHYYHTVIKYALRSVPPSLIIACHYNQ